MYNSLIQLYFDFCSIVWEGLGSELALTLQKLQNRAGRMISYDSSSGPLLQGLRWDNLSVHRIKLLAIKMKVFNNMVPSLNIYAQKFWKWGPIMILGASFLDFNCLFPKPIMAKKVLAIWESIFGINYQRICVDAKQWTFFKPNKLDRLLPSLFDSFL